VKTTVDFCREILRSEDFHRAGLGVDWLPRYLTERARSATEAELV
jgi:hypothetical protein